MLVEESNPVILNDMKEAGSLFASEEIVHSYPHCWRCKKPIIFRATPQWFCSVDSFKDEACAACDDVRWIPGWGIDRMKAMIRERADWCISRQRRWGLPALTHPHDKSGGFQFIQRTLDRHGTAGQDCGNGCDREADKQDSVLVLLPIGEHSVQHPAVHDLCGTDVMQIEIH